MTFRLKRDNVERIADSVAKRDRLISEGFSPVEGMNGTPPEDEGGENETQQEKVKKAGRQRIKQQDKAEEKEQQDKAEEKERQEAGGELNGVPDKA